MINIRRFKNCLGYRNLSKLSSPSCFMEKVKGHEGLYQIILNRPEAKNALNKDMMNLLYKNFLQIQKMNDINLLLIKSNVPDVFCAGADLKERSIMPLSEVGPHVTKLRNLFQLLYDLPVPTIAALDGIAFGGGLEMCLACDIRIAGPHVKMGLVETTLGIIPGAGGTQRLTRLIGVSKAKELIYTGAILDGQMAYDIGLVNRVAHSKPNRDYVKEKVVTLSHGDGDNSHGQDDIFPAYGLALELAKSINHRCAPLSLRCAKEAINKGIETNLLNGLDSEEKAYNNLINTEDRNEGIRAFIEKRRPHYKGF